MVVVVVVTFSLDLLYEVLSARLYGGLSRSVEHNSTVVRSWS
jgi:hypothetical protein